MEKKKEEKKKKSWLPRPRRNVRRRVPHETQRGEGKKEAHGPSQLSCSLEIKTTKKVKRKREAMLLSKITPVKGNMKTAEKEGIGGRKEREDPFYSFPSTDSLPYKEKKGDKKEKISQAYQKSEKNP